MFLILIGFILFLLSLAAFGKSWRVGIDSKNPGKLVTNGIFSITRNPIFVYIDFYFIGTALINTNILFILFAVIVIIGLHYQILQEEKFLSNFYGEEYSEYKKRVRRYI
jgi:protein-S-isoprenylcysteine O-methyltransferase Ste14